MKIAIKIGTNAIFDNGNKKIRENIIEGLARDSNSLLQKGNEVIIITSGAVGTGRQFIKNLNNSLGLKQAQAAVGQPLLMATYSKYFSKYNIPVAQFLLNSDDLNNKNRFQNIKNTYTHLIGNAIPIVNENDTTTTEELSFGDNDFLSAQLVLSLDFDILIILTELGALLRNKQPFKESQFFEIYDYDSVKIISEGFGGLKSKLDSAKKLVTNGKECIIAKSGDSIIDILSGKAVATRFIIPKSLCF